MDDDLGNHFGTMSVYTLHILVFFFELIKLPAKMISTMCKKDYNRKI